MAQYKVYRNTRGSKADIPFLLDVQSDLVQTPSRVVVPLVRRQRYGPPYTRLNPVLTVDGVEVVASVSDLGAVDARDLREPVADLGTLRSTIISAIDFLLTGY